VLPLDTTLCSKKIAGGPMNVALSKKIKIKIYECTHELINTNLTTHPLQFVPLPLAKAKIDDKD
jgi:hypothetical protein